METKHYEVKEYEQNGVRVCVAIDYDNEMISLVHPESGSIPIRYKTKEWRFGNRAIEYMQGWQDIFTAMSYATQEAAKSLKKHIETKEKARLDIDKRVLKEIAKEKI